MPLYNPSLELKLQSPLYGALEAEKRNLENMLLSVGKGPHAAKKVISLQE